MFWTIIALGMTVLMGGIIAYNGDVIGRKYGKKRLTLFGLRPKHTAILITSVTGVFISALTTAAIFLLAPPVRQVILQGERAIRENMALQESNKSLRNRTGELTAQKTTLLSEMKLEQDKGTEARKRTERAEEQQRAAESKQRLAEKGLRFAEKLRSQAFAERNTALAARNRAAQEDHRN